MPPPRRAYPVFECLLPELRSPFYDGRRSSETNLIPGRSPLSSPTKPPRAPEDFLREYVHLKVQSVISVTQRPGLNCSCSNASTERHRVSPRNATTQWPHPSKKIMCKSAWVAAFGCNNYPNKPDTVQKCIGLEMRKKIKEGTPIRRDVQDLVSTSGKTQKAVESLVKKRMRRRQTNHTNTLFRSRKQIKSGFSRERTTSYPPPYNLIRLVCAQWFVFLTVVLVKAS